MSADLWSEFHAAAGRDVLRLGLTVDEVVLILDRLSPEEDADLGLAAKIAAEIREQKIGRRS